MIFSFGMRVARSGEDFGGAIGGLVIDDDHFRDFRLRRNRTRLRARWTLLRCGRE